MEQHNLESVSGEVPSDEGDVMLFKCAYCGNLTDCSCQGCKSVYYCCERHQRADWASHKKVCAPNYLVKKMSPLGHCLIATRAYKKGETIMSEDPFVFGPSVYGNPECCIGCSGPLSVATRARCPGCGFPTCHRKCPALAKAKAHPVECGYLKELKRRVSRVSAADLPRIWELVLPLRCYLLNKTDRSKLQWLHDNAEEAGARVAAEADTEPRPMFDQLRSVVGGGPAKSGKLPFTDVKDVKDVAVDVDVLALLNVYALNFQSTLGDRMLGGLYPNASYLQQSCMPSTRVAFLDGEDLAYREKGPRATLVLKKDRQEEELRRMKENEERQLLLKKLRMKSKEKGIQAKLEELTRAYKPPPYVADRGRVIVTAIRDIKEGEILTCSRTSPLMCTVRRQAELLNSSRTRCRCMRCMDPRELGSDVGTARCAKCAGDVLAADIPAKPIDFSRWVCVECGETTDTPEILRRLSRVLHMYSLIAQDEMMGRMKIKTLEQKVRDAESTLHPHHDACLAVKSVLLKAYGFNPDTYGLATADDQALKKKAALGLEMLSVIERLGPSLYRSEEMSVQCLIEHAKTQLESICRFFEGDGSWNEDRASATVVGGFRRLQRASAILDLPNVRMDDLEYNLYSSLIHVLGQAFLTKAEAHGFKLPKGTLDY